MVAKSGGDRNRRKDPPPGWVRELVFHGRRPVPTFIRNLVEMQRLRWEGTEASVPGKKEHH